MLDEIFMPEEAKEQHKKDVMKSKLMEDRISKELNALHHCEIWINCKYKNSPLCGCLTLC